jgi:uncharacterized protein YihD (DUF1040 family)
MTTEKENNEELDKNGTVNQPENTSAEKAMDGNQEEQVSVENTESFPEVKDDQTSKIEETISEEADDKSEIPSELVVEAELEPKVETPAEVVVETKSESKAETEQNHEEEDSSDDDSTSQNSDAEVDYHEMSNAQLAELLEGLLSSNDFKKVNEVSKAVQPVFYEQKDIKQKEALEKFVAEGGAEDDFEMHWDEEIQRIEASLKSLREKKSQHFHQIEKERTDNLKAKNTVLEKLRELVDGEETVTSIKAIKEIQNEWKKIGQIPAAQLKPLWASYNALMDRFYDQRTIYFELKELDRKKNLEAKAEICEKAEKLDGEKDIRVAIRELNDLHEEFKHIGPVPQEEQQALWDRFKNASDKIYAKRKHFNEVVKKELFANLDKKVELVKEVEAFLSFDSERINEWNTKTKELLELQKKWEAIGGMPKEKAKEVNKQFWSSFKGFFQNKNQFFKNLEAKREENLALKNALVEKALELSQNDDFNKTAQALKKLQADWREIGPVPEKVKDSVYKKFKKACDTFFSKRREQAKIGEQEYVENLKQKEALCEELETAAKEGKADSDLIETYLHRWSTIGFVPKENIRKIQNRFNSAIEAYAGSLKGLDQDDVAQLKVKVKLYKLKTEPDANRKINQKEGGIRKRIQAIENDISIWKNNLEFFANSLQADKLKKDFEVKIEKAQEEAEELKRQLEVLKEL